MYLIGITGGSGSGKTTFASKLLQLTGSNVSILSMDAYYLDNPPTYLTNGKYCFNFDHPEALDWNLIQEHLVSLKKGEKITPPIYDFKQNKRVGYVQNFPQTKVVLFEGIYVLHNELIRDLIDIKCYINVESDIRFIRRLNRDIVERGRTVESVIDQYCNTVRPMHQKYLGQQQEFADLVIGETNDVAVRVLAAKIKNLLSNTSQSSENLHEKIESETLYRLSGLEETSARNDAILH